VPTSAAQVYHFLKVTVNGTNVTVTPINSLGQTFDVIHHNFTLAGSPPSQPANSNALAVSGTQVDLSWSAATDNTRVRGYGIYRNGILVDTVDREVLSFSDTGLVPSTSYSYRVDAFDGSGNHSTLSSARTATTQRTAAYVFAPAADAFVAGDTTTTNYGGSAFLKADTSPTFKSYLRFHVGDKSGIVTKATLRLYTTSSSAAGYQIKQVNGQGWEEGKLTFVNAPAAGATISSSGNFAANNWTSVDVTSLVSGNGVYDFALTTTSTATLNFNSRDANTNQPQLVVETTTDFRGKTSGQWGGVNQRGNHSVEKGMPCRRAILVNDGA
jgi:chitodextrinase